MLLDSVRALTAGTIAPRAEHHDRTGEFPWANVQAINELGLNAMFIPEAYGGAPLSYTAYLACVREISKACASTGIIWATIFHAMKPLIDFGTEEQKQRLLPRIARGGLAALCITEPDGRIGRHRHEDALPARRRCHRGHRRQDLHHQRRCGRSLPAVRKVERDRQPQGGDLGADPGERHARAAGAAHRGQAGPSRLEHGRPFLRRLPRAAGESPAQSRRRPGDPVRLAQQVAAEHRGTRARHRPRRLRGCGGVHQRTPPIRTPDHRVPGHPVHACRSRQRARAVRVMAVAGGEDGRARCGRLRHRGVDSEDAGLGPRHAHGHRRRAAARRLRLLQGLSRRAPAAGCRRSPRSGRAPIRSTASSSGAASSASGAGAKKWTGCQDWHARRGAGRPHDSGL